MALAASTLVLVSRIFVTHPFSNVLTRRSGDEGHLLISMSGHFTSSADVRDANVMYVGYNASLVANA